MSASLPALSFDGSTVIAVGAVLARNWQALPTLRTEVDVILHAPGAEQKMLACVPVLQTLAPIAGQLEAALSPPGQLMAGIFSEEDEAQTYAAAAGYGFSPAEWANLVTTLLPLILAVLKK